MNRVTFWVVLICIATVVFFSLPEKSVKNGGENDFIPVTASVEMPGVLNAQAPTPEPNGTPDAALPLPSSGTALKIIGIYPPGKTATPFNEIIFYFNEALSPFQPPAETGKQAIVTEPPVQGAVFIRDNYLQFKTANLSTVFQDPEISQMSVILHENLRSISGQALSPDARHVSFPAPPPSLEKTLVEEITDTEAHVKLTFSRDVALDQLPALLSIKDRDQAAVSFTVADAGSNHEVFLCVPLNTRLPIDVEIADGLPWGYEFQNKLEKINFRYPTGFSLQQPKALLNTKDEVYIDLKFEEPLPFDWFDRLATVQKVDSDMPIPFTVKTGDFMARNTVRLLLPDTEDIAALEEADVTLSPWIHSMDGNRHAINMTIRARKTISLSRRNDHRQPFQLYYNYWENNITDGLVLRLNFSQPINPAELQSHIEIVPPVDSVAVEGGSYSRHLLVKGAFKSETNYTLRISGGLKNDEGEVALQQDASFALEKTPLRKGAAFENTNLYYFPRRDMANPKVLSRNTTSAAVILAQVFPSNLPIFIRDFSQSGANPHLLAQYAREIGKNEITFPDTRDTLLTHAVDLNTILPAEARGVFIMNTSPAYDYANNSRILIYTDLGALSHWTNQELVVFVHHLYTLEPQVGAKVTVYSSKFQPIGAMMRASPGS